MVLPTVSDSSFGTCKPPLMLQRMRSAVPGFLVTVRATDVVSGTVMLPTPSASDHAVLEQLGVDKQISVDAVIKAMEAELKRYKAVATEAKKNNPQLTLPRFEAIRTPDLGDITAGFHGEPEARDAWAYATAVAELVEQWNAIESQRKTRKYLQEEFGADVRPLPVAP